MRFYYLSVFSLMLLGVIYVAGASVSVTSAPAMEEGKAVKGLFIAFAAAAEQAQLVPDKGNLGKLVRFELVDEKTNAQLILDVPEEYLNRRARPDPKDGLLVIETALPDLLPKPTVVQRKARSRTGHMETDGRNFREGVVVELWGKVMSEHYPANVMRDFPARRDRLPDNVPGLRRFGSCDPRTTSELSTSQTRAQQTGTCRQVNVTEDYFPEGYIPGQPWAYFSCERLELNPRAGCIARGIYRGRDFAFMVRRTELARWKEFDHAVRQLLDRLVVADSLR